MPGGRQPASRLRGWWFLFRWSPGSNRTCTRSSRLCGECVRVQAACIQTVWTDRNRCTACRNEARSRTWDTFPGARLAKPAAFRIANNAKPSGWLPSVTVGDQRCLCGRADRSVLRPCWPSPRYPDNRAGGICDQTRNFPFSTLSRYLPHITSAAQRAYFAGAETMQFSLEKDATVGAHLSDANCVSRIRVLTFVL